MYNVTQDFIDNSQKNGREFNVRITWDNIVFEADDIYSLSKEIDADFYRSVMQYVEGEILGRHDLTDAVLEIEVGIKNTLGTFDYINYGLFIVKDHERIVGESGTHDKTTFKAYDIMLNAHTLYDVAELGINYPISIFNLYEAVATHIGTTVSETSITNGNKEIEEDKWTNIEGVTYRDVLDEIAEVSGTSIMVKDNKLLAKTVNVDNFIPNAKNTIDENVMKKLSIKEEMKPVNILNLSREGISDGGVQNNFPYPEDWETIPVNDRSEIVIPDNQIMDKRREEYAPDLFNAISGLSYYPFEADAFGCLHFEPLDIVNIVDMNNVAHRGVITSYKVSITSGIKEDLVGAMPSMTKEKYALTTDTKRNFMRVYFLVDQQNGVIKSTVEKVGGIEDDVSDNKINISTIEQTVDSITSTISDLEDGYGEITDLQQRADGFEYSVTHSTGNNLLKNSVMHHGRVFWEEQDYMPPTGELLQDTLDWREGYLNDEGIFISQVRDTSLFYGTVSDAVEINPNMSYRFSFYLRSFNMEWLENIPFHVMHHFYDENNQHVGKGGWETTLPYGSYKEDYMGPISASEIPNNAKYIRFSGRNVSIEENQYNEPMFAVDETDPIFIEGGVDNLKGVYNEWSLTKNSLYCITGVGMNEQIVNIEIGQTYTISFDYKKPTASGTLEVYYISGGVRHDIISETNIVEDGKASIEIEDIGSDAITIGINTEGTNQSEPPMVANLMLAKGSLAEWSCHVEEVYTTTVLIDRKGITVKGADGVSHTTMTPYEFAHYYDGIKQFFMNRNQANFTNIMLTGQSFEMYGGIKIVNMNDKVVIVNLRGGN